MTLKTVTSLLGLAFFLNSAFDLTAQPTPADIAEEEAVRRQEAIQLLHMKLADAAALQKSGRYVEAAKVYEDAYALFPRTGDAGGALAEDQKAVRIGLVDTRLKLAQEAQARGDLLEADSQIKRAQKVDPQHPAVLSMKLQNDKAIASSKGNKPSTEALSEIPKFQNEKVQVGTMIQDAKLMFEMGRLDEAEAKLRTALARDPLNTPAKYYLDLIKEKRYLDEALKRDSSSKDAFVEVEKSWNPPVKRESLPFPNPLRGTNLIHTSLQRQEIMAKLNSIRLNEVGYDGLPLVEVLKHLTDESIKRDPDKNGLNFMINPHSDAVATVAAPSADPNAPLAVEPLPSIDISSVTVKISPPLRNLRMADVLDAVISSADQPIRYELRDYAVVFSPKPAEPVALFSRNFKVDPNTFVQGMESVIALSLGENFGGQGGQGGGGGGGQQGGAFTVPRVQLGQVVSGQGSGGGLQGAGLGLNFVTKTNHLATVNEMARAYFNAAGVNLDPPKSVFWNDRSGILYVRASLQDLEIIEIAVQTLNATPPQIMIEAKFAEFTQADNKGFGFDWILGNVLLGGGRVGMQGGSAPSFAGEPSKANPSGIFPGPGPAPGVPLFPPNGASVLPSVNDGKITSGVRNVFSENANPIPELGTITGILTDPQFRLVIRAIEQRSGVDVLAAPKVTTLSGRQAQIAALDLRTIVTGTEIENNNNTSTANNGGNTVIQNSQPQIEITTQPIPFGPALDVIPSVSADGFSVQMTLIPTMTEFVEYEDPGPFAPTAIAQNGLTVNAVLPLPRLRIRQVTTSCVVYDGQTVMLGGLIAESIVKLKDKVPMLGDLPGVGRFFRSESKSSDKRNLVIFVTPTIIDPAGNRVHSDDELPFARSAIPPQMTPVAAAQ